VPSRLNQEGDLVAALGGVGFLTVAPDYLGLGDSPGFHPYVHAETEATASVDMLRAAREFAEEKSIYLNDQVFVAGYSQGGHAAMALHRKLELELSDEFTVTAAAPMSGPYSIGEVMQQLIFTDTPQEYFFPAYVPYTVLSFQYAGQTVYNELTDLFKPEYAVNMEKFFNEDLDLQQLNFLLVSTLTLNTGASIPVRMFQDNIIHDIKTDPNHPFNLALKANNVYDWSPKAPTRLFYCEADDQVPAQNSLVAEAVMLGNGAADLDALDVQSDADHVECVLPAALATVSFFSQFQVVGDTLADAGQRVFENLKAYPNPAAATVYFENLPPGSQVRLLDLQGNFVFSTNPSSTADMLSLPVLPASLYVLEVESEGYVWRQKWFVKQ
jgi:pimeloyl-ACP methyl ester carboxylesterase